MYVCAYFFTLFKFVLCEMNFLVVVDLLLRQSKNSIVSCCVWYFTVFVRKFENLLVKWQKMLREAVLKRKREAPYTVKLWRIIMQKRVHTHLKCISPTEAQTTTNAPIFMYIWERQSVQAQAKIERENKNGHQLPFHSVYFI